MQIVVTVKENPAQAVSDFLANKLECFLPNVAHACHDHAH